MTNYVFVHGGSVSATTWNKLSHGNEYPIGSKLGGQIWGEISKTLEGNGHNVYAPTLPDEYENNLSDHIQQICQLIINNKLDNIILVGHSYGGMVITGVADKLSERISYLFYIDAALPEPGDSLFSLLEFAGYKPNEIIEGRPAAYIEKIKFNQEALSSIKKVYLLCTESEFIEVCKLAKDKVQSAKRGWLYKEIIASHLPMATHVDDLVKLLEAVQQPSSIAKRTQIIEVVPYDERWVNLFSSEATSLKQIFKENFIAVHHIGSTAIPDMPAKPTIDILLEVKDIHKVDKLNSKMEELGYEAWGEYNIPRRRFFVKGEEKRTHHVHVFQKNDPEVFRHLAFRDYPLRRKTLSFMARI